MELFIGSLLDDVSDYTNYLRLSTATPTVTGLNISNSLIQTPVKIKESSCFTKVVFTADSTDQWNLW